jgi:uncharacterized protein YjbJ (UPF0337 family)
MNTIVLEGKWKQLRGEVRRTWGKLTNNDLDKVKAARTAGWRASERYGYAREQAEKEINAFLARFEEKVEEKVKEPLKQRH